MPDFNALLPEIVRATEAAGKLAQRHRRPGDFELKPDGSIVTNADREAEIFLREALTGLVPGTTVWGEELGYEEPGPNGLWLVDPVDGTTNFAHGSPLWGVSVALLQGEEMVAGVIDLPDLGKTYHAARGLGAMRNGVPLRPLNTAPLKRFEPVGLPESDDPGWPHVIGKMRHFGAWVIEACWFLEGWTRAAYGNKASLYDIAASIVLTQEMGGIAAYGDGSPINHREALGKRALPRPFALVPTRESFLMDGWPLT